MMRVVHVWFKKCFYKVKRSLQLLLVKPEKLGTWSKQIAVDMKETDKLIKSAKGKAKVILLDLKAFQKATIKDIEDAIKFCASDKTKAKAKKNVKRK